MMIVNPGVHSGANLKNALFRTAAKNQELRKYSDFPALRFLPSVASRSSEKLEWCRPFFSWPKNYFDFADSSLHRYFPTDYV